MMKGHCEAWDIRMTNAFRVQLQPSYILHQRPYRDTSIIVDVFTESFGRRSLVARGAKRPKSKLKGLLQPFQPLLISWVGKTELVTLTDAEHHSHLVSVKSGYLPSAFYLNELLLKLLHKDDPHAELFTAYHHAISRLKNLDGGSSDDLYHQACLRAFETQLLQSIGYGLVLDHDVSTQREIDPDAEYEFVLDRGPIRKDLASATPVSKTGIVISGNTLIMLNDTERTLELARSDNDQNRQLFREAKRLLRTVIDYQLGNKNLHSRDLLVRAAVRLSKSDVADDHSDSGEPKQLESDVV